MKNPPEISLPRTEPHDQLRDDELTPEESQAFQTRVAEIGRIMLEVYGRRDSQPYNYDGYCLFYNDESGQAVRMHMHICMQPGDEGDAELFDKAMGAAKPPQQMQ